MPNRTFSPVRLCYSTFHKIYILCQCLAGLLPMKASGLTQLKLRNRSGSATNKFSGEMHAGPLTQLNSIAGALIEAMKAQVTSKLVEGRRE